MVLKVGETVSIYDSDNQFVETLILKDGKLDLDSDICRDLPVGGILNTKKYCFRKDIFGVVRILFSVCQRCNGVIHAGKSCDCPGGLN